MSKKSTRGKRHSTDAGPPKVSSKPYLRSSQPARQIRETEGFALKWISRGGRV
jgi:hypothetical protein